MSSAATFGVRSVLLIVIAAGLQAFCSCGRQQVFWLGFFSVMLVMAYNLGVEPRLLWVYELASHTTAPLPPASKNAASDGGAEDALCSSPTASAAIKFGMGFG